MNPLAGIAPRTPACPSRRFHGNLGAGHQHSVMRPHLISHGPTPCPRLRAGVTAPAAGLTATGIQPARTARRSLPPRTPNPLPSSSR